MEIPFVESEPHASRLVGRPLGARATCHHVETWLSVRRALLEAGGCAPVSIDTPLVLEAPLPSMTAKLQRRIPRGFSRSRVDRALVIVDSVGAASLRDSIHRRARRARLLALRGRGGLSASPRRRSLEPRPPRLGRLGIFAVPALRCLWCPSRVKALARSGFGTCECVRVTPTWRRADDGGATRTSGRVVRSLRAAASAARFAVFTGERVVAVEVCMGHAATRVGTGLGASLDARHSTGVSEESAWCGDRSRSSAAPRRPRARRCYPIAERR